MGEHKKYGGKSHVHKDMKKEEKKSPTIESHWYCVDCKDYTPYDYQHNCKDCGRKMIWA